MFLRPGGYVQVFGPGQTEERDSFTCNHCQFVTTVAARCDPVELGGHCKCCDKLICKGCVKKMAMGGNCIPWEKQMIQMENREAARRSYGI